MELTIRTIASLFMPCGSTHLEEVQVVSFRVSVTFRCWQHLAVDLYYRNVSQKACILCSSHLFAKISLNYYK
jgi:hypothetical protein